MGKIITGSLRRGNVQNIFGDIPNSLNQRNDNLIGGCTLEDHSKIFETVLQLAKDFGITFNREKCLFGVSELEFYGYKFSSEGLKPTEDKVKAVKDSKPPESRDAVKSFVGMIGYLSKSIPRYAVLTAPLWATDSFHEGLSAGLFQRTSKGLQPVHFISRSMTNVEKRYSQTEKGALAVKWSKIVSKYDQEIPQSQTADNPMAPRGRAAQPSRDTRKTKKQSNRLSLPHQDDCNTRM